MIELELECEEYVYIDMEGGRSVVYCNLSLLSIDREEGRESERGLRTDLGFSRRPANQPHTLLGLCSSIQSSSVDLLTVFCWR